MVTPTAAPLSYATATVYLRLLCTLTSDTGCNISVGGLRSSVLVFGYDYYVPEDYISDMTVLFSLIVNWSKMSITYYSLCVVTRLFSKSGYVNFEYLTISS